MIPQGKHTTISLKNFFSRNGVTNTIDDIEAGDDARCNDIYMLGKGDVADHASAVNVMYNEMRVRFAISFFFNEFQLNLVESSRHSSCIAPTRTQPGHLLPNA